jgi:hypothetical protein
MQYENIVERKAAVLLLELPEDFTGCELTPDQRTYWLRCREFNYFVSLHWLSRIGFQNDPLSQLETDGKLKRQDCEIAIARVDLYQRLWELSHSSERYAEQYWPEIFQGTYPFAQHGQYSSLGLFWAIVTDWNNSLFLQCLKPYQAVSVGNSEKRAASQLKVARGEKPKFSSIARFKALGALTGARRNQAMDFLIYVSEQSSARDRTVKRRLEDFWKTYADYAELMVQLANNRRDSKYRSKPKSHTWKGGQMS